jgi:hypothetical protein
MKEIKQNVKAAQISKQTLDDAMKELIKEDTASTKLSSAFKGHKGRKEYNYIKNYPQQALKRQLEVSNTQPSTNLQNVPRTSYLRNVNTKKNNIREKYEKAISEHPVLNTDLQNKKLDNVAATKINSVIKGHLARKDTRNKIINLASTEKAAATTLQSAIRNRTAKRDMMKQRQLVGEAELKQMEAAKDKAIKDDAAKKLQASIKRIKPQNNLNQIKQAKEQIGAKAKRLLTEKVNSIYIPKIKKTAILNKFAVGQRLVVNKRKQLVSKKKHDAGVFGYETRQDFFRFSTKL